MSGLHDALNAGIRKVSSKLFCEALVLIHDGKNWYLSHPWFDGVDCSPFLAEGYYLTHAALARALQNGEYYWTQGTRLLDSEDHIETASDAITAFARQFQYPHTANLGRYHGNTHWWIGFDQDDYDDAISWAYEEERCYRELLRTAQAYFGAHKTILNPREETTLHGITLWGAESIAISINYNESDNEWLRSHLYSPLLEIACQSDEGRHDFYLMLCRVLERLRISEAIRALSDHREISLSIGDLDHWADDYSQLPALAAKNLNMPADTYYATFAKTLLD